MRREGKIFCKRCWYDLRGIESNHCPECGKHFNANFPNTFRKYDGHTLPKMVWLTAAIFLIAMAMFGSIFLMTEERTMRRLLMCSLPIFGIAMFYGVYSIMLCNKQVRAGWRRRFGILVALLPILTVLFFIGVAAWHHD